MILPLKQIRQLGEARRHAAGLVHSGHASMTICARVDVVVSLMRRIFGLRFRGYKVWQFSHTKVRSSGSPPSFRINCMNCIGFPQCGQSNVAWFLFMFARPQHEAEGIAPVNMAPSGYKILRRGGADMPCCASCPMRCARKRLRD